MRAAIWARSRSQLSWISPLTPTSSPSQSLGEFKSNSSFSLTGLPCSISSTISCPGRHVLIELEPAFACPTPFHSPHTQRQSALLQFIISFLCWMPFNTTPILRSLHSVTVYTICFSSLWFYLAPHSSHLVTIATLVYSSGNTLHSLLSQASCTCQSQWPSWPFLLYSIYYPASPSTEL